MGFCANCGKEVRDGDHFCMYCGTNLMSENDDYVFDGKIHKCPQCGEVLGSFAIACPTCGYEIVGKEATDSARRFYSDFKKANTVDEKDHLIRNFPIPNAKEDVLEFLIIASSNIYGEDEKDIFEAWISKLEQVYQKAQLLFKNEDLEKIEEMYQKCLCQIEKERRRKAIKFYFDLIINNIGAFIAFVLLLLALYMNVHHENASMVEFTCSIVLIISTATLGKRNSEFLDFVFHGAVGLLFLIVSYLFYNGSLLELAGGLTIIISAICYFKKLK